jgi:hypothetical protein
MLLQESMQKLYSDKQMNQVPLSLLFAKAREKKETLVNIMTQFDSHISKLHLVVCCLLHEKKISHETRNLSLHKHKTRWPRWAALLNIILFIRDEFDQH